MVTLSGSMALKAKGYIIDFSLSTHKHTQFSSTLKRLSSHTQALVSSSSPLVLSSHQPCRDSPVLCNGCFSSLASYSFLCCPGDQWPLLSRNAFELDPQGWHSSARSPPASVTSPSFSPISFLYLSFFFFSPSPTFHWGFLAFFILSIYPGISGLP